MGRLHCVLLITPDLARQREFYAKRLGLSESRVGESLVSFALRGAALVLRGREGEGPAEIRLAITASPLEARLEAARARGGRPEGEIVEDDLFRAAQLRDPEGNRVELVEPRDDFERGDWPRLSRAIVNASKFDATVAFYRDVIGLKVAEREERWVEFDTGDTSLTVHDREDEDSLPLYADQRIAFAFEDEGFDTWIEELRERGLSFATAPAETELGLQAEVEDADGWFVVLNGPPVEEPLDADELDAEYGDGDDEPHGLPRRGGELGGEGARRSFNPGKVARKQAARASTRPSEPERGGFVPSTGSRPSSPRPFTPRPYSPRPDAPGGATPRPHAPREGGTSGPRPYPPREGGPRPGGAPSGPRPEGLGRGPRRPPGAPPDRDRRE
jgi:catechol 2,3-dioxygenase-like lactoylglutathione lyase family enzyme